MSFESGEIRLSSTALCRRLRWLLVGFVILLLTVFGRLLALEMRDGHDYRTMAAEPVVRKHTVPAMRGRILARDGTVLAYDQPLVNLALNYRWLEEPADSRWLYRMARARLSATQRRDPKLVAQEEEQILAERHDLHERLASLCGMSETQWHERTEQIQKRVEALAGTVNTRHQNAREAQRKKADDTNTDSPIGWLTVVSRSIGEALSAWDDDSATSWLSVAEEQSEHVICADLPLEAVAEIETHTTEYPGVTLTHSFRRAYPQGDLAAHAVGYLGLINAEELAAAQSAAGADAASNQPDDLIGRAGVERQYEKTLRGHRGLTVEQVDARGRTISSTVVRQPKAGTDVVLTIDPALQRTAQALLDQALARRLPGGDGEIDSAAGGALLAMDIQSGAILAAASGPRFNCDGFAQGDREAIAQWLNDPARPLFDRTVQMALPPGSVFKTVSAVAMLNVGVKPEAAFECQGYLKQPDALRCAIFRRFGFGHGAVTMSDALARSCNVYFFHYAAQIGAAPLVDWARRLGMGQLTGVDLPGEAKGNVPATSGTEAANTESLNPQEALMISIGQGPITATPLQVVRMMAAVANGGYLVSPHVVERLESADSTPDRERKASSAVQFPAPRPVPGLNGMTLAAIHKGLRQTVSDEQGTAHAVINLNQVTVAGKTGTAETGGNQPEHAWFVGYAPAERPQIAFVVVLEHAGNAPPATGPVIQYLVKRMDELGYFSGTERWAAGGTDRKQLVK